MTFGKQKHGHTRTLRERYLSDLLLLVRPSLDRRVALAMMVTSAVGLDLSRSVVAIS